MAWSPIMETPTGPARPANLAAAPFTICPACHRPDFHRLQAECHTCGYNATCGACGTDINATDYFTPFACSASCDAEMGAWTDNDERH